MKQKSKKIVSETSTPIVEDHKFIAKTKGRKREKEKLKAEATMAAKMVLSVLLGGFVVLFLYLYESLVLKPKRLRSKLEKQGIRGPSPSSVLLGNIPEMKSIKLKVMKKSEEARSSIKSKDHHLSIAHDWPSTIFPHLVQWTKEYGNKPSFVGQLNFKIYFVFWVLKCENNWKTNNMQSFQSSLGLRKINLLTVSLL